NLHRTCSRNTAATSITVSHLNRTPRELVPLDSAGSVCALLLILYFARVRYLMSCAKLRNIWSHLPAWGALLLSGGALISGDRAGVTPQPPGQSNLEAHEVVVKIDGEKLFISQDGSRFEELRLGDTREAVHLR